MRAILKTFKRVISILVLMNLFACWLSPNLLENLSTVTEPVTHVQGSLLADFNFNDFITAVYQAPADQKQALVDSFMQWADSTTGMPYQEDSTAYFLYLNGSNPSVSVAGDFNGWDPAGQGLNHLSGTNLYYRSHTFEMDARLDYKLVVNDNWILDPLNPRHTSGGYGPNSELAMAGYLQPPEIQTYAIPHGEISYHSFTDTTQGRTRPVRIYTPPGYAENALEFRTIFFHDGNEYLNLGYAQQVLDYLIANHEIPPVIGIFVDPTNRNEEYSYDLDFMNMFVNELVPWVDANYRTLVGPENRAVAGVSLGGLSALLFTLQHPDVFGNCGAYSPAIWFGDLFEQYTASEVLPVRIYMDAGTYESSILNSAGELETLLTNNGWDLAWHTWHEGHSWGAWRAHLDESLKYFWPLTATGIDDRY